METPTKIRSGNGHTRTPPQAPPMERVAGASTRDSSRLARRVEAEVVTIERSAAGVVTAERVELRTALAGAVLSSKEAAIDRGLVRQVIAGGPVELANAGAGTVIAAGDVKVARAGVGALLSLGHLDLQQAGACGLVAGSATVGRGGTIGMAITPRLVVSDGGRVLVSPVAALSVTAGALAGLVVGWLIGRVGR